MPTFCFFLAPLSNASSRHRIRHQWARCSTIRFERTLHSYRRKISSSSNWTCLAWDACRRYVCSSSCFYRFIRTKLVLHVYYTGIWSNVASEAVVLILLTPHFLCFASNDVRHKKKAWEGVHFLYDWAPSYLLAHAASCTIAWLFTSHWQLELFAASELHDGRSRSGGRGYKSSSLRNKYVRLRLYWWTTEGQEGITACASVFVTKSSEKHDQIVVNKSFCNKQQRC